MRDSFIRSRIRRQLLLLVPATLLRAQNGLRPQNQQVQQPMPANLQNADDKPDVRLPNGKRQTDEILKDDYQKNLKDARDLTDLARALEGDLEKNEAFVFSLASLKKLDDMERLTRRIRGRMKRF
jgi:hypothetical protein